MMKRLHGYHSIISYIVKVHLPIIIQIGARQNLLQIHSLAPV